MDYISLIKYGKKKLILLQFLIFIDIKRLKTLKKSYFTTRISRDKILSKFIDHSNENQKHGRHEIVPEMQAMSEATMATWRFLSVAG